MTTELVGSGFSSPVFLAAPPGDTERLFVVEQAGLIRIIKNGTVLATPFLDWTADVLSDGNEQGLLGLAFHPDFDTNGIFYIYYTAGNLISSRSIIRRFQVSANPDVANVATSFRIFRFDQTDDNHNGGHIEFGPDNYLYLGLGDGGGAGDPFGAGQNPNTLLGKMLRIDPNSDDFPADAQQNYAIPPTNPFVANPGVRDEIWALGMRNPYRYAFDELTGDLYIGDVGQTCWEEIDIQPGSSSGGENYGWDITEGNHCFFSPGGTCGGSCNNAPCGSGITFPVLEYCHNLDGFSCSITGGRVYRGDKIPTMQGHYFYADFCSNQIYTFRWNGNSILEHTNRTSELDPPGASTIEDITAFGKDGVGELYIVERTGQIWKIIWDPKTGAEPSVARPSLLELSAPTPNPFRSSTVANLTIDATDEVDIAVYSAAGRLVRQLHSGPVSAGTLAVEWDGRDASGKAAAAGAYFVRAKARSFLATQPVTLLR
jgi:hypothetical protein